MATSIASAAIFAAPAEIVAPVEASFSAAHVRIANPAIPAATNDRRRIWLWSFLAVVAASQLYFFRELLAAFALFSVAFAVVAFMVASLYMLIKSGELVFARLANLRQPALQMSRVPRDSRKLA